MGPFNQFVALCLDSFLKTAAHGFNDRLRAISPWACYHDMLSYFSPSLPLSCSSVLLFLPSPSALASFSLVESPSHQLGSRQFSSCLESGSDLRVHFVTTLRS